VNRAIFLDRDGTIIEDKDYLSKPEDVVIFPGAVQALKRLQDAGFILIMVTNQSGVGRGYFTLGDVERVHAHIATKFAADGVQFRRIYIAPEAPDQPAADASLPRNFSSMLAMNFRSMSGKAI
jgi:D-glycero-D-manno-heptose 1,7-bisphosphate phosphatase